MEQFNGVFFGIFQSTQIIGNLGTAILLSKLNDKQILFYAFIGVATCGSFLLIFLKNQEPLTKPNLFRRPTTLSRLSDMFKLFKEAKLVFLIPLLFYSGLSDFFFFFLEKLRK